MSRISRSYAPPKVRFVPTTLHEENFDDLPPPPPPLSDFDVRVVDPSQVQNTKIGSQDVLVKVVSKAKWKVSKPITAAASHETPSSSGQHKLTIQDDLHASQDRELDSQDLNIEDGRRRSLSPKPLGNPELPQNVGAHLMESCQTCSWTSVESLLRLLDKAFRFPEKRDQVIAAINASEEANGITPLMICARESRIPPVEQLEKLGVDVNAKSKDGETALHFAVREGKEDMVRLLIHLGADATVQGGAMQQLPLHLACVRKFGAWPIVQLLIPHSGPEAKLIPDRDGYIPLWRAAETGNLPVLRELLVDSAHQQLSYQNKNLNGDTIAHHMIRQKNTDILKVLLESDAPTDFQNFAGETLLHVATLAGHSEGVTLMYDKRADPDIVDQLGRSPLYLAVEKGLTHVVDTLIDRFRGSLKQRSLDGNTLVHIASKSGHASTVRLLLDRGVPINMRNKMGDLALHVGAKNGHVDVVAALIAYGSVVDARTKGNYTSLHLAVENGHPAVVESLVGSGAAVNAKGGPLEETALHIAARASRGDASAEILLKSGANHSFTTLDGQTPLHVAATSGSLKVVQTILADGGSTSVMNNVGETPLHIAVRHCCYDVAREFLDHISRSDSQAAATAAVNAQNEAGETTIHLVTQVTSDMAHFGGEDVMLTQLLLDYNGNTNVQTKESLETPLHYCARYGNYEILSTILNYLGPEKVIIGINKLARNGWSPLLTACEEGHADVVKILLRNNARVDVYDEEGRAALHLAAERNHLEVVDLLLHHKAFVNAKNKAGVTPAHLAAERGAADIVELLVGKYQANTDVLSLSRKTPLHLAAQAGQFSICERLLRLGADPMAKDQRGQTPLHLAADQNHEKIVQLFLNNQKEVDPTTIVDLKNLTVAHTAAKSGSMDVMRLLLNFNKEFVITAKVKSTESTALHLAAAGGHADIVRLLVEEGANASEENKEGLTPLHLAGKYGHIKVLECLKDYVSLTICSVKIGLSTLHLAALAGQVEFARELLISVPVETVSAQPTVNNALVKHLGAEAGLTALHLACHSGQENMVRLLLNYPGIMADAATETTGMTPLHLTAMNGHLPIVALLLSKIGTKLDLRDKQGRTALMLGCTNGHADMCVLLLGQGSDIAAEDNNGWSPLHHGAFTGQKDVVKALVEGAANTMAKNKEGKIPMCLAARAMKSELLQFLIAKPHDPFSLLDDKAFLFDLMTCSKKDQNKPLQDFIIFSPSPVELALKLSKFFTYSAKKEQERERDLTLAAKFTETLGNDLLTIACNKFNPAVVLRATDKNDRSLMAILIDGEHKEVVSLPAVQRYLTDVWHGNQQWSDRHSFLIFFGFLLCPPLWVLCCLPLGHKYSYVPFVKLMCHIVSHILFILVLILVFMSPFKRLYERTDAYPSPMEMVLVVWMLGKLIGEVTSGEERSGLGWIRVLILGLCGVAVIVHFVAFAYLPPKETEIFYIRNQILGLASFFAFIQIISYLSFHYMFGPFAIIIRDVVKDLMRFLVILVLFLVGFTFCLSSLFEDVYRPPAGFKHGEGAHIMDMFMDPLECFKTLYFALFGLIDHEDIKTNQYSPDFGRTLVTILYMIYLMVTMVVLINLLIAMLSDTYQRIQARSDLEWKYGRAKLVMNMDQAPITPPPMNTITVFVIYLCNVYKKFANKNHKQSVFNIDNVSKASSHNDGMQWRKSFQSNGEEGASQLFRNIPARKLPECIDWKAVVAAHVGSSNMDDEDLDLQLEIENEMERQG